MKEFLAKWKILIGLITGVLVIVGVTTTVIVKAQTVATCEQVESAKVAAVEIHKNDFAELSDAFQNQQERAERESNIRQRQSIQQQTWETEDRMKVEGQTPYLQKRWRQLKQDMDRLDRGGK